MKKIFLTLSIVCLLLLGQVFSGLTPSYIFADEPDLIDVHGIPGEVEYHS